MISKITKLNGIGTLHAPLPNGALSLKKKTIIYGENGRGKSTLVAIIRSLACGDTAGLRQRKTIKGIHPQTAQFLIGTQPHELSNDIWSKTHPEICVFDATFISENVYSGASIDPDQRKNLLNFAIGNQGVSLAKRVDELATEIATKRQEETAAKEQLKKFIKGNMTPEQFAALTPTDSDSEAALDAAKKRRDAIARSSSINSLQPTSPISFDGFNHRRLIELLEETIEAVSKDAAERVHTHIENSQVTEKWLEEGSQFATGDTCPYCAQSTERIPLVEAYKLSFSEAYKNFKAYLKKELETLEKALSGEKWLSVKGTADGNRTKLVAWKEFLPDAVLSFDFETNTQKVQRALEAVREVVDKKLTNPLESVTLTTVQTAAIEALVTTISAVDDYNVSQVALNEKLADLKTSVARGNLEDAEAEVFTLENRITRKTAAAEAASKILLDAIAARERLEDEKSSARLKLDTHTQTVVGQYKDSINKHLKGCRTSFRIKELKTVYTGAKPRFDYAIELLGSPVDLANKPNSPVVFDSALSFGDKSALAFAFFLAKLENDPNRSQQTVVFDDPLSSLDSSRRRYTRQQIAESAPDVAQLIVLTHEEATVADISMRLDEHECAIFELRPHGDFSVFTSTTVKEITASEYSRCFDSMTHYLHGSGRPEAVVKQVRPFLEMNIRYRFPADFGPDQSLGKMIGSIKTCDTSKPLSKLKVLLPALEEINDYTTTYSHGDMALVHTEKILDSDLKAIVTKAIDFGHGLPN